MKETSLICLIVFLSLVILLFILDIVISGVMVHKLSYPIRYETKYTHDIDLNKGLLEGINILKREKFELKMRDSYLIHGDISLLDNKNNKKWMIITHGYTWTREGSLKYAKIFYKLGYNILIYDNRSHGENRHDDVTMGYKEAKDLDEIITYVIKKYGDDVDIGLHGESLGAAITLMSLKYKRKNVKFVVADSSYSSLKDLVRYQLTLYHLPRLIMPTCSLLLKIFHGYFLKDVDVVKDVKDCSLPVLLIHGDNDTFIPKDEAMKLHQAIKNSELRLYEGCDHTQSVIKHNDEYSQMISDFLSRRVNK
jgi:Dipeptidyl aminopeptidases/acylaminoacyl-peptidases